MIDIPTSEFMKKKDRFPIDLSSVFQYDNINKSPKPVLDVLEDIKKQINDNLNKLTNENYKKNYKLYYNDYLIKLNDIIIKLNEYDKSNNKKNHECYNSDFYKKITNELNEFEQNFNFYNMDNYNSIFKSYESTMKKDNESVEVGENILESTVNNNISRNKQKLKNLENKKKGIDNQYNNLVKRFKEYSGNVNKLKQLQSEIKELSDKAKSVLPLKLSPEQIDRYIKNKKEVKNISNALLNYLNSIEIFEQQNNPRILSEYDVEYLNNDIKKQLISGIDLLTKMINNGKYLLFDEVYKKYSYEKYKTNLLRFKTVLKNYNDIVAKFLISKDKTIVNDLYNTITYTYLENLKEMIQKTKIVNKTDITKITKSMLDHYNIIDKKLGKKLKDREKIIGLGMMNPISLIFIIFGIIIPLVMFIIFIINIFVKFIKIPSYVNYILSSVTMLTIVFSIIYLKMNNKTNN